MDDKNYHVIEIRVPVPGGRVAQNNVIAGYETEMEALRSKVETIDGAKMTDKVSTPRGDQSGKPRKTQADKIAEAVAAARSEDEKKRVEDERIRQTVQSAAQGDTEADQAHAATNGKPRHPAAQRAA